MSKRMQRRKNTTVPLGYPERHRIYDAPKRPHNRHQPQCWAYRRPRPSVRPVISEGKWVPMTPCSCGMVCRENREGKML